MAKDVDLSSRSWCDIIFEGKNKEFGAYELRQGSPRRHTIGMIWGLILAAAFVIGYTIFSYFDKLNMEKLAQERKDARVEQTMVDLEMPEEEEEEEDLYIPPEEEIIEKEEVANEQQVTATLIVEDEEFDKSKQVLDESEKQENEAQFGAQNITEGTNDLNKQVVKEEVIVEKAPVETIFRSVEQMPQFPGGEGELLKWISSNIKYPAAALEKGVSGRVTVQFVVTKDGSIGQVNVVRGRDPDLDKEAVRVVKSLPKFIPGKMNGQAVSVWYTLPINFTLQ